MDSARAEVARTALRLGAAGVTIVYRRTAGEMPAYAEEVEAALEEGVALRTLVAPVAFVAAHGAVTGVACRAMKLGEFDRSGRRRPEADAASDSVIEADQVILAIGQTLNVRALCAPLEVAVTESGWIKADPVNGSTSLPWLFAGGDACAGPSSVVEAIAAGERAAVGMDAFLTGEPHAFWRAYRDIKTDFNPDADPAPYARENPRTVPVDRRRSNFDEVEQPWNDAVALRQARRCLRCDYGKSGVTGAQS